VYKVGKPEGRRSLGRSRRRWENGIGMDLREIGLGDVDWIRLAQDKDLWRAEPSGSCATELVNAQIQFHTLSCRTKQAKYFNQEKFPLKYIFYLGLIFVQNKYVSHTKTPPPQEDHQPPGGRAPHTLETFSIYKELSKNSFLALYSNKLF
jgi:hypothetical protein